ncbi:MULTISPECIES: TRAP transporter small permease [Allobacillus]|uniref:TRAP transporter small permease n=1 Tax=Allobacillus halotolerans TaxID=570278 RepID=A0ABS6GSM8_9BACI|nr:MULTISPECIES: TRAP transporter small permease [Allobacillus]MBU6081911.1 TRAP transporter small permease [Allobacillus halotolerans]TSJ67284.1 TRAP transporter small permease [Allobacillus sp. SKP2-8]
MNWLRKIDRIQAKVEGWMISYALIAITLVLLGNVIARSVFNNSWTFAEEVGQFLIILITFVGLSFCARWGRHLKMTAIVEFLPYKVRKALVIFVTIFTSILLFYLSYLSIEYVLILMETGRTTPALQVPYYLVSIFIPLGFFFAGIQYAMEAVLNIRHKELIDGTQDPILTEIKRRRKQGDYSLVKRSEVSESGASETEDNEQQQKDVELQRQNPGLHQGGRKK